MRSAWRRLKLELAVLVAEALRQVLARSTDATWVRLLRVVDRLAPGSVGEVIEIVEAGPPGSALLRRMVTDSTREELRDMVWGSLFFDPMEP